MEFRDLGAAVGDVRQETQFVAGKGDGHVGADFHKHLRELPPEGQGAEMFVEAEVVDGYAAAEGKIRFSALQAVGDDVDFAVGARGKGIGLDGEHPFHASGVVEGVYAVGDLHRRLYDTKIKKILFLCRRTIHLT